MPHHSVQTGRGEWSRSRYWLCHFLYSRHERTRINWSTPLQPQQVHATASTLKGMLERLIRPQAGMTDTINTAQDRCAQDPAFVQTLRLLDRERQFHRDLLLKLARRHDASAALPVVSQVRKEMTASLLGIRYFLASLLLDDVLDLTLLERFSQHWQDEPAKQACSQLMRDKANHAAYLRERLTMEYAEFNVFRRTLRRMRLRSLFAIHLRRLLKADGATLQAMGVSRLAFARLAWRRFEVVLEMMVPYRRDRLMSALMSQHEKPYERAEHLPMA